MGRKLVASESRLRGGVTLPPYLAQAHQSLMAPWGDTCAYAHFGLGKTEVSCFRCLHQRPMTGKMSNRDLRSSLTPESVLFS